MDANGVQGRQDGVPELAGYQSIRMLGVGSQAQVWLVRPEAGGAPLAAKCFPPPAMGEPPNVTSLTGRHNESQITQEWRILAQYDHEHLLRVHGVVSVCGALPGGCALLMDYAAGGSIQDVVAARGPLSVGECVTILTPLGQVLSYLHGLGVVHGDVAPGNVLLSAHGKPVLGDLGFGRLTGQPLERTAGTPGFFCQHDDGVSAASDVYAMAAVGWFALTGHAPAVSRDRMPLAMYARQVPDELAAALEAGLTEDASQRPTAAEFAQAVFRSARAEPVALAQSVHPSVLPELLTRREARRPAHGLLWPGFPGGWPSGAGTGGPRRRGHLVLRGNGRLRRVRSGHRQRLGSAGRRKRIPAVPGRRLAPFIVAAALVILAGAGAAGWRVVAGSGGASDPTLAGAGGQVSEQGVSSATATKRPVVVPTAPASAAFKPAAPSAGTAGMLTKAPAPAPAPALPAAQAALGGQGAKLPAQIREGLFSPAPEKALVALAWVRSYALSTADLELLELVNAPGSPAMAADTAVVRALAAAGHHYTGLETGIAEAAVAKRRLLPGGSDAPDVQATVSATVTTGPFAEQDANGAVVHSQAQAQEQDLLIVLVQVRSRWVVQRILAGGR